MLKDHLGNVRMVLTEEQKVDAYPAATSEPATIATEELFYGNLSNTQVNKPSWFTDPVFSDNNTKVSRLKNAAGSQKIGPNMMLKVMAGDKYSVRVSGGWSDNNGVINGSTNDVLTDLLNLVSNGLSASSGGKATATQLQSGGILSGSLSNFLNSQTTVNASRPRSYLNWILFDEQFNMVSASSGFVQVGKNGNTVEISVNPNLTISKNSLSRT
jgi:hypothetical protein